MTTTAAAKPLRYSDYYAYMSLADFLAFEAQCTAGAATPASFTISNSSSD